MRSCKPKQRERSRRPGGVIHRERQATWWGHSQGEAGDLVGSFTGRGGRPGAVIHRERQATWWGHSQGEAGDLVGVIHRERQATWWGSCGRRRTSPRGCCRRAARAGRPGLGSGAGSPLLGYLCYDIHDLAVIHTNCKHFHRFLGPYINSCGRPRGKPRGAAMAPVRQRRHHGSLVWISYRQAPRGVLVPQLLMTQEYRLYILSAFQAVQAPRGVLVPWPARLECARGGAGRPGSRSRRRGAAASCTPCPSRSE